MLTRSMLEGALASGWFGAGLPEPARARLADLAELATHPAGAVILREGAGVVTTRAHVRTVVTEWGVAELFGRSLRERASELIAIAHPDVRDALTEEARQLHLL